MQRCLALLCAMALTADAGATTYHVAANGDDGRSGLSWEQAWATIHNAMLEVDTGDTVLVGSGSYTIAQTVSFRHDNVSLIGVGQVVIDGSALPDHDPVVSVYEKNGIVIDGLEVSDGPGRGIAFGPTQGSIIRNCDIHGTWDNGVFAWYAVDVVIEHNDIHHCGNGASPDGITHGVYVARGCAGVTFAHNRVHHNAQTGLHCNGNDYTVNTGIVIDSNQFYANAAKAADMQNTHDSFFINNLVHGNAASAPAAAILTLDSDDNDSSGGLGGATGSLRNQVVNNTFVSPNRARAIWLVDPDRYQNPVGAEDCVVFNNIVLTSNGASAIDNDGVNNQVGHNLTATISPSLLAELFADPGGDDYRIVPGSGADGAGAASFGGVDAPATDIVGTPRSVPYDQGAYQMDPPTVADAGIGDLGADDLRAADLRVEDTRVEDVQIEDVRVADVRVADVQIADVRVADVRVADVQIADVRVADVQVADVRVEDVRVEDVRVEDVRVEDVRAEDVRVEDVRVEDVRVEDARGEDARGEDARGEDARGEDARVEDLLATDLRHEDRRVADYRGADYTVESGSSDSAASADRDGRDAGAATVTELSSGCACSGDHQAAGGFLAVLLGMVIVTRRSAQTS